VLLLAEAKVRSQQLARIQRLPQQLGHHQFHPVQKENLVVCLPEEKERLLAQERRYQQQNRHQQDHRDVSCLHHLSGANADRAKPWVDLDPEQQPVRRACREMARRRFSGLRRHHLNMASRKAGSARPQNLGSLVAPQTLHSKGAGKLSELSVAGHRRQRVVPVRVSVAAAQNKDNRATVNLARHLAAQAPARREAEKSVGNLAPINLQPRHLPVRVRAKPEADEREGRGPMVNLPASQKAERQLRLSKGRCRGNRSAERKKAKGLHRRGHNYLANFRSGFGQKPGAALFERRFVGRLCQTLRLHCFRRLAQTPYKITAVLRFGLRSAPRL
jgi:hypothetical protein